MNIFNGVHYAPNSKEAARSFNGGARYEPAVKITRLHWDTPPLLGNLAANEEDLTGRKFGWLTVIGKMRKDWMCPKSCWCVRCVCGNYETRKANAIKNPANNRDKCTKCAATEHYKKLHDFNTTGKWSD